MGGGGRKDDAQVATALAEARAEKRAVLQRVGWGRWVGGHQGRRTFAHVVQHELSLVLRAKAFQVPRPQRRNRSTTEGRCWLTRCEGAHLGDVELRVSIVPRRGMGGGGLRQHLAIRVGGPQCRTYR